MSAAAVNRQTALSTSSRFIPVIPRRSINVNSACLLTVDPGLDMSTEATAITGEIPAVARVRLRALHRAHLLIGKQQRWRFHDLIRLDAQQHAIPDIGIGEPEMTAATERLLDCYLDTTHAADQHLHVLPRQPVPDKFIDRDQALAWLDDERVNLIAAVRLANYTGRYRTAIDLTVCMAAFLRWRRHLDDALTVAGMGVWAAVTLCDFHRGAAAFTNFANALHQLRQFESAIGFHIDVVDHFRAVGDRRGEAMALNNHGNALREAGRLDEAITSYTRLPSSTGRPVTAAAKARR